jgi:hypothetical protein
VNRQRVDLVEYKNNSKDVQLGAYKVQNMDLYQCYGDVDCGLVDIEVQSVRIDGQSRNENFSTRGYP